MKRLLFQAVFLAMGMIMGVYASGDVGLDLMCGALVAVCCAAVGEYASGSWLAMALIVMLDCGACLVPAWYLMLPIAAFNAASSSAVVDGSRFLQALVPRWLWLLPMTIVIFRSIDSHVPSDLSIIILMVLQTVLGFAAGLLCTRCSNLAREVRRLQDSRRDEIRRLRSQIADEETRRAEHEQLMADMRRGCEHEKLVDEALRTLLLCKLEQQQDTMVHDHHGVADNDFKLRAQRVYDAYHGLGGNGHGTQINNDIQNAPIAPRLGGKPS